MLNKFSTTYLKNKYFFTLCFYFKTTSSVSNLEHIFLGYKYNYLILNINIFLKNFKNILLLITKIIHQNGSILFLSTNNKIIDYILQQNCKKEHLLYLQIKNNQYINPLTTFFYFPDLIINLNFFANKNLIKKLIKLNLPIINFIKSANDLFFPSFIYTLLLNHSSIYVNLIIIYVIFLNITVSKRKLGSQFLNL